jgi:hypothetical protein
LRSVRILQAAKDLSEEDNGKGWLHLSSPGDQCRVTLAWTRPDGGAARSLVVIDYQDPFAHRFASSLGQPILRPHDWVKGGGGSVLIRMSLHPDVVAIVQEERRQAASVTS